MNIYGYVRVSSTDQNEDRQMVALREVDVQTRCLILKYLCQMGIHSDTINQFIYKCSQQSKLEQAWVKAIGLSENKVSEEVPVKAVCKVG